MILPKSIKDLSDLIWRYKYDPRLAHGEVKVCLFGYDDTYSNDSAVAYRLGMMRAMNVASYLFQNSDMKMITVASFGNQDLMVATPPGVDEPQNRRVEIDFAPTYRCL